MAADLHIIAFDPAVIPVETVKAYMTFDFNDYTDDELMEALDRNSEFGEQIYGSWNFIDNVWVGEVSWLKAGMDDDGFNRWIPKAVLNISTFYADRGSVIRITKETIPALTVAFNVKSDSAYEKNVDERGGRLTRKQCHRGVNRARNVKRFLERNIGNYTFVDSW